jgi:hypothetical protein
MERREIDFELLIIGLNFGVLKDFFGLGWVLG